MRGHDFDGASPLRIVWFTDPHVVVPRRCHVPVGARHGTLNLQDSVRRLERLRDHVARATPQAVLCTGDLVDTSARWRVHARRAPGLVEFEALRSTVSNEDPDDGLWVDPWSALRQTDAIWHELLCGAVPMIALGNHDSMLGEPERLAALFGLPPTHGTSPFTRGLTLVHRDISVRVLIVDSTVDADPLTWRYTGRCAPATRAWIKSELDHTPESLVVLAMHHGPQAFIPARSGRTGPSSPSVRSSRC